MNICVYGAASSKIDSIYLEKTYELGAELARRNIGLVFGGGANGVMGSCARGAYSQNGVIIGIVPRFFDVDGVKFDNCTEMIFTEDMRQRKKTMEEKSDAFIVAPGGIGTFDEFFEILTLQNLDRHRKPIVIYNINGFYDGLIDYLSKLASDSFVNKNVLQRLIITSDINEIFDRIENFIY